MVDWLVSNAVFSETALNFFLIFCTKLGYYQGRNVAELDLRKKSPNKPKISNTWFVGNAVFSEKAIRIFLIFCIKLGNIEVEESRSWNFEKNCWFGDIGEKLSKLEQIRHFHIFVKSGSNDFFFFFYLMLVLNMTFNLNETYFHKNLQFGHFWPQNCQKIAQIVVYGYFMDFVSLVFLDFAIDGLDVWSFSYNSSV